jgi:hypothetical protein
MEACCFPLASCLPLSRAAGRPSSMLPLCSSLWGVVWPAGPHAASAQRRRRLPPRLAPPWEQLLFYDARRQQWQARQLQRQLGQEPTRRAGKSLAGTSIVFHSSVDGHRALPDNFHDSLVHSLTPSTYVAINDFTLPELRGMPACWALGSEPS